MNSSSIASIIQAMLASSQPTVTQMAAARGGGGGGNRATAQGTNMSFSGGGQRPTAPDIQAPELSDPVSGESPSPEVQVPFRPGMSPDQVTQRQLNPDSDPYQSGQYRQEDDPDMQFGGNPDSTALIQQSMEAQMGLWEAQNPTTLSGAWNRNKNVRKEMEKVAQSKANIHSYEQAQALKAKAKEAERVGNMADNAYMAAMDITGDKELSRAIASQVYNDPDNATQVFKELTGSAEAQRAEKAGYVREDVKEVESRQEKLAALKSMGTIPDAVSEALSWQNDMSAADLQKMWIEDDKRARDLATAYDKEQTGIRDTVFEMDNMIDVTKEAIADTGYLTTGVGGVVLGLLPGTPAADLKEMTSTLKANLAFKRLFDMRQASTTGGALGNVSNQEIKLLHDSWRSLSQFQSEEQMEANLNAVLEKYERVKYLMEQAEAGNLDGVSGMEQAKMADEYIANLKGGVAPPDPEVVEGLNTKYGIGNPQL